MTKRERKHHIEPGIASYLPLEEVLPQKVKAFEWANRDLNYLGKHGVAVRVEETANGRLKILIEVSDDAIHDDVRDIIPLALAWRDRLQTWQGAAWTGDDEGPSWTLEKWHQWHEQSPENTYAKLAELINAQVAKYLIAYAPAIAAWEATGKVPADFRDAWGWKWATQLLEAARVKDDIPELLNAGIANIRAGRPPFEVGQPVDAYRMQATLKSWRGGRRKLHRY